MTSSEAVVRDRYGLHPRAAMRVSQAARQFTAAVTVESTVTGARADARSLISLVSAGIRQGEQVLVSAEGEDEAAASEAIRTLLESGVCHP